MSHRSRQPVVLTSFKQGSLDTYLNEWRTIRESRVISQEETSEEEGEITFLVYLTRGRWQTIRAFEWRQINVVEMWDATATRVEPIARSIYHL